MWFRIEGKCGWKCEERVGRERGRLRIKAVKKL